MASCQLNPVVNVQLTTGHEGQPRCLYLLNDKTIPKKYPRFQIAASPWLGLFRLKLDILCFGKA